MAEPTREEVKAVLVNVARDKWIMASLMYGAGLRLMECLRLRVQDLDFARSGILVRDGKGAKDRMTMLPESLKAPLQDHLKKVRAIHEKDLADGWGRVQLPSALDRKYPNASADWRWQWVFPQENRWTNPETREQGRHHIDGSLVQKAMRDAVAPRTCSKAATISERSRNSWAIAMSERR
jgi:integrase